MSTKTNVYFILDKSGSMTSISRETIDGFNEYISALKKDKKGDYNLCLTLFDTSVTVGKMLPIAEIEDLTDKSYDTYGMTALFDAVCQTLVKNKKGKGKNLVVIMTDGQENSSKEYSANDLKSMIKDLELKGNWSFVFLGANQDAWLVGEQFGFKKGNVATYKATPSGMGETMRCMAANTQQFSAQSASNTAAYFSDKDKENLLNAK